MAEEEGVVVEQSDGPEDAKEGVRCVTFVGARRLTYDVVSCISDMFIA